MPEQQPAASLFEVAFDGKALAGGDHLLVGVSASERAGIPPHFELTYRDPRRSLLDGTVVKIGTSVTVRVATDDANPGDALHEGEVTAFELEVDPRRGTLVVIRGYHRAHRLFRHRQPTSYLSVSYPEIARSVFGSAGLGPTAVDAHPVTHQVVPRGDEDSWTFLSRLADEIGYELGVRAGTLGFRKPAQATDPVATVLSFGTNLLRLRASASAGGQDGSVVVQGWNPLRAEAVSGRTRVTSDAARTGIDLQKESARAFGAAVRLAAGSRAETGAEADAMATALAQSVGSAGVELDGTARGNAQVRCGAVVELKDAGEAFAGRYVITSASHQYSPEDGYVTSFTVSGAHDRSLSGLVGAGTGASRALAGVMPAIVTDNADPGQQCRVRVQFGWAGDDVVSGWLRIAQPAAGDRHGTLFLPEVGDEVLVAFEAQDLRRAYVVGGLWSDARKPPSSQADVVSGGRVVRREITTRSGHSLVFSEAEADNTVVLKTGDGQAVVTLGPSGTVTIAADGALKISANGITIDGGAGTTAIKGSTIELN